MILKMRSGYLSSLSALLLCLDYGGWHGTRVMYVDGQAKVSYS